MLNKAITRHVTLLGILFAVLCLGYFYMLDRFIFSSTKFTLSFKFLLTIYDIWYAWLIVAVCILAAIWNRPGPILRLVDFLARHPVAMALMSTILLAIGTIVVYHNYALCMDEYAAVFQSKIFATGRVSARLPPQLIDWLIVPGFNGAFLFASSSTGQVIEGYWPGFALLLAPFQALGLPWLCNPLLAGLSLYLIYRITFVITCDQRAAGFATLFALASGAFVANAISYYSMQAHLTANLVFVWLLLEPTRYRALAAGLVGSMALVLHNPVPHVLFALPWLFMIASTKEQRHYLIPLILGYLPLSLILGLGWLMLRAPIQAELHNAPAMSSILSEVFRWPDAAMLNMRVAALAKMWVWAAPCLFIFALLGRLRHGNNRHVRLLTQSAVLTFFGYLFVDLDQGHGWGYRYFHSAWGVIPVLAGCAMTGRSESEVRLVSFAGAAAILSVLIVMPYQMSQISEFISSHLEQIPPPKRPGNNVYFIRGGGFYVADMVQMDPLLRAPDLFFVSHGPKLDADLVKQYWPNAVKLQGGFLAEQWYLGPEDQRRSNPGTREDKHFVFDSLPITQSQ
jgi:hypothetical protein